MQNKQLSRKNQRVAGTFKARKLGGKEEEQNVVGEKRELTGLAEAK